MKEKFINEVGHHFIILSDLGKGAFGKVYECINIHTHKTVALKIIRKYKLTQKQLSFAEQEARILQKLNHSNIVKLFALYHTESFLIIEMEYLREKSLAHLLTHKRPTEEESSQIMRGIFQAVSYLHKSHVIHRDLKPDNIIFASKDLNSLKLADFGLSTEFELGQRLESQVGTLIYMAPELLTARKYTETADIWSCGIILYNLLCGRHPLYRPGDNYQTFTKKLENIQWTVPSEVSSLAKDLFFRCVKQNPIERYSASLALNHPWVTRAEGKIPITHIEEIRIHQDRLKMKVICLAALCLASLQKKRKELQKVSLRIQPTSKTSKTSKTTTRSQGKLLSIDTPLKITRKRSQGKMSNEGLSLMTVKSPSGSTKNLPNTERRGFNSKIKLSPLPVKQMPKSADR
jgi:serine/threonine protein kinase